MNLVLSYCTARQFCRGFVPLAALTFGTTAAHNDNERPSGLMRRDPPDTTVMLDAFGPMAVFTSSRAGARFLNFLTLR